MFGLGASELLVIAIVVLVLLLMGKLPDVARKAGGAYRTYRQVERDVHKAADPRTWIDAAVEDDDETKSPKHD